MLRTNDPLKYFPIHRRKSTLSKKFRTFFREKELILQKANNHMLWLTSSVSRFVNRLTCLVLNSHVSSVLRNCLEGMKMNKFIHTLPESIFLDVANQRQNFTRWMLTQAWLFDKPICLMTRILQLAKIIIFYKQWSLFCNIKLFWYKFNLVNFKIDP